MPTTADRSPPHGRTEAATDDTDSRNRSSTAPVVTEMRHVTSQHNILRHYNNIHIYNPISLFIVYFCNTRYNSDDDDEKPWILMRKK